LLNKNGVMSAECLRENLVRPRDVVDGWLGTGLVISVIQLHNVPGGARCFVLSIRSEHVDFAEVEVSILDAPALALFASARWQGDLARCI
jgi:hypothetical protein